MTNWPLSFPGQPGQAQKGGLEWGLTVEEFHPGRGLRKSGF